MRSGHRRGRCVAGLALAAAAWAADARAACLQSRPVLSWDPGTGSTTYVYSPFCPPGGCADAGGASVSSRATAFFWSLGLGDPAPGLGVDSGTLPGAGGILVSHPGYPTLVQSDWAAPPVDGCIGGSGGPACLALAIADRAPACAPNSSCIALAALTLEDPGAGEPFVLDNPSGRIDLSPVPRLTSPGSWDIDFRIGKATLTVPHPESAYLDPACPDPFLGYRVWTRTTRLPLDVDRSGWQAPAAGGSLADGSPIPFGTPTDVIFGCNDIVEIDPTDGIWLGYGIVMADGFELPWVEVLGGSEPIYPEWAGQVWCCNDTDADGACADILYGPDDCDEADPYVYPGAEQLCGDSKNNDCDDPQWPGLDGTNETDNDGDGLSECAGDCNDRDPTVQEPAVVVDVCDGIDNDCDGRFDQVPLAWNTFAGAYEDAQLGVSLAGLDGGRFVVGARWETVDGIVQAGAARVFTWPSVNSAMLTHPAPGAGDSFGIGVARLGDVNGDGAGEIFVGANLDDVDGVADAGSAFVFSGAAADGFALLYALVNPDLDAGDEFGYAGAGLDDVNDDGVPDLVVGARADDGQGSATVFSGADGTPIRTLVDPDGGPGDLFGYAVAGGCDLDGDGVGEIVVGAYQADTPVAAHAGEVFVFSGADGGLLGTLYDPAATGGEQLGRSLARLPDLDGDESCEILAGAPALPQGSGEALVFSGASGAVLQRLHDPAGAPGDAFGYRVATIGDLDGDAVGDVLVGAFGDDTATGVNAGSVLLFSGATGDLRVKLDEPQFGAGALLGAALAAVADLDDDGVPEFVAGAYRADRGVFAEAGSVRLFHGASEVDLDGDHLGDACDPDQDGDGVLDTEDCAPRYAAVSHPPDAPANLRFDSLDNELLWDPFSGSYYKVYAAAYAAHPGLAPAFDCLSTTGSAQYNESTVPPPGTVRAYLVRVLNTCGVGSLDTDSNGAERLPRTECP